jgi:hypothetical protein
LGADAERIDTLSSGFYSEYKKLMKDVLHLDQHFQVRRKKD